MLVTLGAGCVASMSTHEIYSSPDNENKQVDNFLTASDIVNNMEFNDTQTLGGALIGHGVFQKCGSVPIVF